MSLLLLLVDTKMTSTNRFKADVEGHGYAVVDAVNVDASGSLRKAVERLVGADRDSGRDDG